MKKRILILTTKTFIVFAFSLLLTSPSYAWTVSPVRYEIKGERGKEYTFKFEVLNESQTAQKRFKIFVDDWRFDERSNFVVKSLAKEDTEDSKYSASSWIKVTPAKFVAPPGASRKVRFTVTVPADLPSDGSYYTGIFVGEENIEKPPKGERVVHIKQNTLIGVVVYINIGEESHSFDLTNINVEPSYLSEDLSYVTILPAFENMGNVYERAHVKLKLTPVFYPEIDPEKEVKKKNKTPKLEEIEKNLDIEDVVVLRDSMLEYPITLPLPLPVGSKWSLELSADHGKKFPLLSGKKSFEVTAAEQPKPPESKHENPPVLKPTPVQPQTKDEKVKELKEKLQEKEEAKQETNKENKPSIMIMIE